MKNYKCRFQYSFLMILFSGLVFISGCSQTKYAQEPVSIPPGIDKILVLSFTDASDGEDNSSVRCPLSGKTFLTGKIHAGSIDFLNNHMRKLLGSNQNFKFISSEHLKKIQADQENIPEIERFINTGKKLKTDAVLTGHIYRYQDRVGGKYSVESPASIAFDIHLVRVADGRLLWSAHFDETQKALTDDLFQLSSFLKRDGQWITADQMAAAGLEHLTEGLNLP
ncbi:Uncharacterized protein dnl_43450 [Desulfonema limicola]|uniref:Penicillin-binding protein activator LpoB n=1 Tax=Desulfonema limicola TaxID=45656 RepID=A0A975BB47_9BACT|nr:hypothetical protein [Desulfonema limicola]QTA81984.1 Uncharacterized protein dnl_43450 [Desulfonema limicola]